METHQPLNLEMSVAALLNQWPQVIPVFLFHRMACVGCNMSAFDTLGEVVKNYGIAPETFLDELIQAIQQTPTKASGLPHYGEDAKKSALETTSYTHVRDLKQVVKEALGDGVVARVLYHDPSLEAVLFAFDPGQELAERASSGPAVIQILEGDCEVTFGEDRFDAQAGFWARIQARLPYSLFARTPAKALLITLFEGNGVD